MFQHGRWRRYTARIEHDKTLLRVMVAVVKDDTQLFKRLTDDPNLKRMVSDASFRVPSKQVSAR